MNRAFLQQLANSRRDDAEALLATKRWSGAYYLIGYAAECGLKSCVLHHIEKTGVIFSDKKYLTNLSKAWTHKLDELVVQAGLEVEQGLAIQANPILGGFWGVAKDWSEDSRYQDRPEVDARALFEAITNEPDGVLKWIQKHW